MASNLRHRAAASAAADGKDADHKNIRIVDDRSMLRALAEDWPYQETCSPGLEHVSASVPTPGSGIRVSSAHGHDFPAPSSIFDTVGYAFVTDHRDAPIFWQAALFSATAVPSAIALLLGLAPWWWGLIHVIIVVAQLGPMTLALHVSLHKPSWRFKLMETWIPIILAPFYGQTFNTYYFHHLKMHHVEDNAPADLSSTMFYQRDNFLHFLHYYMRFYWGIAFELPKYFIDKRQSRSGLAALAGELTSYAFMAISMYFNPTGTFFAVFMPFNISRFFMMTGNWAQHAFLDPRDPLGGGLSNSITVVSSSYNTTCFNDGYHATHHLNAKRHWSEHPRELLKRRNEFAAAEAVVFKECDFNIVFVLLMLGRYDIIASKWVNVGANGRGKLTQDEVIALLKEKTRRWTPERLEQLYGVGSGGKRGKRFIPKGRRLVVGADGELVLSS